MVLSSENFEYVKRRLIDIVNWWFQRNPIKSPAMVLYFPEKKYTPKIVSFPRAMEVIVYIIMEVKTFLFYSILQENLPACLENIIPPMNRLVTEWKTKCM